VDLAEASPGPQPLHLALGDCAVKVRETIVLEMLRIGRFDALFRLFDEETSGVPDWRLWGEKLRAEVVEKEGEVVGQDDTVEERGNDRQECL
jgi:hypothetical protein